MSVEMSADAACWLVWSNEHRAWWRAERCGYTSSESEAGRYTFAAAKEICRDGGNPRAWSNEKGPYEMMVPAPEVMEQFSGATSAIDPDERAREWLNAASVYVGHPDNWQITLGHICKALCTDCADGDVPRKESAYIFMHGPKSWNRVCKASGLRWLMVK